MQTPIEDIHEPEIDDTETETDAQKAQQLEAYLRDSIVGRYIRNYNKRLRTLSQNLEKTRQQVDDKLAAMEQRFIGEIADVKADIRKLSEQLESDNLLLTADKVEALIDTRIDARLDGITGRGEADLQKLSALVDEFAREFQAQIDRLSNETKLLREQTRRNQEALRTDLTSETETLEATKIDRLTLSETLITLGMKLKEDNLFDEFGVDLDLDEDLDTNLEES
jgi:phage host-nuclease inhibitor protein Gam